MRNQYPCRLLILGFQYIEENFLAYMSLEQVERSVEIRSHLS